MRRHYGRNHRATAAPGPRTHTVTAACSRTVSDNPSGGGRILPRCRRCRHHHLRRVLSGPGRRYTAPLVRGESFNNLRQIKGASRYPRRPKANMVTTLLNALRHLNIIDSLPKHCRDCMTRSKTSSKRWGSETVDPRHLLRHCRGQFQRHGGEEGGLCGVLFERRRSSGSFFHPTLRHGQIEPQRRTHHPGHAASQ